MKKKLLALMLCAILSVGLITGCGKDDNSTASNATNNSSNKEENNNGGSNGSSNGGEVKEGEATSKNLFADVDNYTFTATVSVSGMESTMKCKTDMVNKITYCATSTMGMETEQYVDYKNGYSYQKINSSLMGGSNEWEKEKIYGELPEYGNDYASLVDYVKDLEVENKNGGKLYTGKIDATKIAEAMDDAGTNYGDLISGDIEAEFFVNADGYLEYVNYSMEIMGMTADTSIKFSDYNTTGEIELPEI